MDALTITHSLIQMLQKNMFMKLPVLIIENKLSFKIKFIKAIQENFQFIILSKSRCPNYDTLINSSVPKESAYEIARINHRKQTKF